MGKATRAKMTQANTVTAGCSLASGKAYLPTWKSRLPLVVTPVLLSFREMNFTFASPTRCCAEAALILFLAATTGYFKLPFSVTWWLVLTAAFLGHTQFLVGVATVLSLTVLLGWYGLQWAFPHSICALWGGSRVSKPSKETTVGWRVWDIYVHAIPALLLLYWHGPRIGFDGSFSKGSVSVGALLASLPLSAVWLWGVHFRVYDWPATPWRLTVSNTNLVYHVEPELPHDAWVWVYGSHTLACILWLVCLLCPAEVLLALSVFVGMGVLKQPFTTAWWCLFIVSLLSNGQLPLLQGITWCCGLTMAFGWYSTQVCLPYVFRACLQAWLFDPVVKFAPTSIAKIAEQLREDRRFYVLARFGDILTVHALPAFVAACLFRHNVTPLAVVVATPSNLIWLLATGGRSLADTNLVYGVKPDPPQFFWKALYASHGCLCLVILAWSCLSKP